MWQVETVNSMIKRLHGSFLRLGLTGFGAWRYYLDSHNLMIVLLFINPRVSID